MSTNPLFSNSKLKLGTFGTNLKSGCAITTGDGALDGEWATTVRLAKLADEMKFEAIIPVGRFRGVGGASDYGSTSFDPFTFAAALGAVTDYPALFATSIVPSIHPILAAKQCATIDHISGGRFALNLVTGWNQLEIEMFGIKMLEHDARYDCAVEWLDIIKMLWTRDEPFDYDGKYYKINKGMLKPHPLQTPAPPIMCAGGSPKGRHFAAKHCDIVFTGFEDRSSLAAMQATVEEYRSLARTEYGREIGLWTHAYVVQGDTEEEAMRLFNYYVHEKADVEGADNMVRMLGLNSQTWSKESFERLKEHLIAGWGAYPLVGTPEQIAEGLKMLSDAGVDGLVLSWPGYMDGVGKFKDGVLPLLKQLGLR